jgi:HK97 family phage prohead protease
MEHRKLSLKVKDIDQLQGIVEGEASTVDIVDHAGEKMMPGAFTKTIKEAWDKVLLFYGHNHRYGQKPIGRVSEFLRMEGNKLVFKGRVSKTQEGIDTLILLADKVITELSVGFEVVKQQWKDGFREILEVKLFEISFVDWGCNPETSVRYVKSLNREGKAVDFEQAVEQAELMSIPGRLLDVFYSATESIRYDGSLSDEDRYNLLQDTLKHFREKYYAWIEEAYRSGNLKDVPRLLEEKDATATLDRDDREPEKTTPEVQEAVSD